MNTFLRVLSTAVTGMGLIILGVYVYLTNDVSKAEVLNQPSYYEMQNHWYVFLSGIGCLAVSLISCFLSWLKSMDTKVEVLPNAVDAQKDEVETWLSGSSLDTRKHHGEENNPADLSSSAMQRSSAESDAVMDRSAFKDERTIVGDEKTELQKDMNKTVWENTAETVLDVETILDADNKRTLLEETLIEGSTEK